jgi:hypothetical protein
MLHIDGKKAEPKATSSRHMTTEGQPDRRLKMASLRAEAVW